MKESGRKLRKRLMLFGLVCLVFGILYLVNPKFSTEIISKLCGIALIVIASVELFDLVVAEKGKRILGNYISRSFLAMFFGVYFFLKEDRLPLALPLIAGFLFIYMAGLFFELIFVKISFKSMDWWTSLLFSLVAIASGIFALEDLDIDVDKVMALGILLIVMAALVIYSILSLGKYLKEDEL